MRIRQQSDEATVRSNNKIVCNFTQTEDVEFASDRTYSQIW